MPDPTWHALEAEEALKELGSDAREGLSGEEAARRLDRYGPNELRKEETTSPWSIFLGQFKNILIVILLVATALSAAVGEVFDAALIFVIVVFCALLGFVQEYRAEKALEALKKMLAPTVRLIREGRERDVPSREVVPGDILLLEAGFKVPADARLVENASLKCDESALTGESLPVTKGVARIGPEVRVADRTNMIHTGTVVAYGRGKAVVTATGSRTEFGRIAEGVAAIKAEPTPLEKRTAEIGKWLGLGSLAICLLIMLVSVVRESLTGTINLPFVVNMVMFAVALAVAAVPEALAAIVTGALAVGMHQMAKNNALIRRMPAVETLGSTTVICSDKTGTLTKGEMTVRRVLVPGRAFDVTGVGYAPSGEFKGLPPGDPAARADLELLLQAGVFCNDARLEEVEGRWAVRGDPTEGALVVAASKLGLNPTELRLQSPRIEEIPFSSERKRMTTIHRMRDGRVLAFLKGAPELVLAACDRVRAGGGTAALTSGERDRLLAANAEMAAGALRVLGFAVREIGEGAAAPEETVERDMVFLGLMGMIDPPREEVKAAIQVCRDVRIKPIMITGDHKLTALAVAREIGIFRDGDSALTGEDLDALSDEDLAAVVDRTTVYARVSPSDKIKIVRAWKARGEVVAMTGDGVNDAPALKQADIGVAMGISGTDVAKEAADMVLNDDNFATIVKAVERGRWIYDNIKKYLTYLLRCNITEVIVIGGAVLALGPGYLPLLPAAILYINLVTDGLPALALGVAPPDPDIMRRPPRDPKERVFTRDVLLFLAIAVVLWSPLLLFVFIHGLKDIVHARTELFYLFLFVELVIALNSRSLKYSFFEQPPHKWLIVAVASQVALTAGLLTIPSLRAGFGVLPPRPRDFALMIGFGAFVFLSMEGIKAYLRRRAEGRG
ncbi:MAG TPA: cation-translocating P-type ATPase [Candidatus Aminicenantes bacterium]|nr:cation-translocating P-type ATPase [Candidatus Aminicenantes bacterium]